MSLTLPLISLFVFVFVFVFFCFCSDTDVKVDLVPCILASEVIVSKRPALRHRGWLLFMGTVSSRSWNKKQNKNMHMDGGRVVKFSRFELFRSFFFLLLNDLV